MAAEKIMIRSGGEAVATMMMLLDSTTTTTTTTKGCRSRATNHVGRRKRAIN